ncbi:MAG TPA: transketolase [Alphaproteobacteria bacterium]|nr:transketolase [Alphaproteobacteria bacterium]
MDSLHELLKHGQSYWLDNLSRAMIADGSLERRVRDEGLRGITSNPEIFERAFSHGSDYDAEIAAVATKDVTATELYERVTVDDVQRACDILRPVYDESRGLDGYVSLEVSPRLAHNTEGSIAEARRLFKHVDRPNAFIKIPGTVEGIPAIEALLYEGININITLLFAVERYEAVAEAYLSALERRVAEDKPIDRIASVASFFLSRIDVLVDRLLAHRAGARGDGRPAPDSLMGKVAVANAKLAYQSFKRLFRGERWAALEARGARPQRLLWASTSTKNPAYPDTMYVEPLIGPHTVTTLPIKTIEAFRSHGTVADTLEKDVEAAREIFRDLAALGIDFHAVTSQLEDEGIQKFIEPYDASMRNLAKKCELARIHADARPLAEMARRLRRLVIRMTTEAGSGHPTSCMSCAELVAALFFHEMRWDPRDPEARNVDTFILSKGHAAPILWAALSEAGAIRDDPLTLRKLGSTLEGHPTPNNPWVRVATGSLGQGLAAANGIALANRLDGIEARIFCLLGDGECSEGSVWEAAQFASLNKLKNLVAIVDANGLGQSGAAPYGHHAATLVERFAAFGWHAVEIDGHDVTAILEALLAARETGPTAIVARTIKGKGVAFLEDKNGWHGKPLDREQMAAALAEIGEPGAKIEVTPRRVGSFHAPQRKPMPRIPLAFKKGDAIATREAYGEALARLGACNAEIVAIDGDVQNSTGAAHFSKAFPDRFFEGYIAEQNMVGVATGLAVCQKIPYVATFACFLTRAYDFIRMAAYSRPPHLVLCGSHAGVSIGEDGPSQMGLEDIAMFRAVLGSKVLYPADAVSAARLTEEAARADGIVYLRTTRPKTPVIYDDDEEFPIGGSKTVRASAHDAATVVAAGITLHEALAAHELLKQKGIAIRVIDAYSVKPLDIETLAKAARETKLLVVVEDHWSEGGLGEAVAAAIGDLSPVHRLAVSTAPRSGTGTELLERHGISRHAIEKMVMSLAA